MGLSNQGGPKSSAIFHLRKFCRKAGPQQHHAEGKHMYKEAAASQWAERQTKATLISNKCSKCIDLVAFSPFFCLKGEDFTLNRFHFRASSLLLRLHCADPQTMTRPSRIHLKKTARKPDNPRTGKRKTMHSQIQSEKVWLEQIWTGGLLHFAERVFLSIVRADVFDTFHPSAQWS